MNLPKLFSSRWPRSLLATTLALALGACGSTQLHYRSTLQGTGSEWRAAGSAAEAPLALVSPRFEGNFLSLGVESRRFERQFVYDLYVDETRRSQDPNLAAVAVGVTTLGLFCLASATECFGSSGEWRASAPERRNERPSGLTRPLVEPYDGSVSASVLLQGFDSAGGVIGQAQSSVSGKGRLRVPVKTLAEQLPQRPAQVRITTTLRSAQTEPARHTLAAAELAPMQLYAEHWLSPPERQALYIARLKPQLLAGDHRGALQNFAALEALPVALPDSFLYLYAQSLLKTGAREPGRQYLQKYLTASGEGGTYAAEARAQLAQ
jgi:hypothetical protein